MKSKQSAKVQLTVRDVPEHVGKALKKRAQVRGTSLNTVLVDALVAAAGLNGAESRYADLDDLFGTWVEDPEFDKIVESQDQVDEAMWR